MANQGLAEARYYVYLTFDPSGTPRYVGKGCGRRWKAHGRHSHNPKLVALLDTTTPPIVIVRDNITEEQAFSTEMALIAVIGREDLGTGPLYNETMGGSAFSGVVWTDDRRLAVGERFRGKALNPGHRAKIGSALKGRLDNNEAGRLASPIAKAGHSLPPHLLERMRQSKTGVPPSSEAIRKSALAKIGVPLSDAHKAAISRGNKGKKKRPRTEAEKLHLSQTVSATKWWRTSEGRTYRAAEARDAGDIPGRGSQSHGPLTHRG